MLYPWSVTICAVALAFVVAFCQEIPLPCHAPNKEMCSNPNSGCRPGYNWIGWCSSSKWCCSETVALGCRCVGIQDLGNANCTNVPPKCKRCCSNIVDKKTDPIAFALP